MMPNYFIPDSEQELNDHNEQLAQIEQNEIPQEQHEAEIIANMITEAQKHNLLVEVVYFFGIACRNNRPLEVSEWKDCCDEALGEWIK
jgi:hypothetical protein